MITPNEEKQPLTTITRVYTRRWWILTVFCFAGSQQAMMWNTWGPIAKSVEIVLGWTDSNIAMPANLANIAYVLLVFPATTIMDTKGLRFAMLLCTSMMLLSAVIRCFSLDPTIATITAYTCAFVKGAACIVPYAGPSLVASIWFPPSERPIATSIASFFNYFGLSLSYIIGPQLVPDPVFNKLNETYVPQNVTGPVIWENPPEVVLNLNKMRQGIFNLMYTHSVAAAILFIIVIVYFPTKPPNPPSKTASIERTNYKRAIFQILRNEPLWLVVLAGSLPIGVLSVWQSILDVLVKPLGTSQIDAGWMGFWHSLVGCFSGIIVTKCSDYFYRRRKVYLILSFLCAAVCCVWFALLCGSWLEYDLASLYASCILLGIFMNGTIPLFYEMSAEASYPVGEGVTGGFMTSINIIASVIFYSLMSVPGIGTAWTNWALLGGLAAAIPMLCAFPERLKRTDIDLHQTFDVNHQVTFQDG